MWYVNYDTMNDNYTKSFKDKVAADRFVFLIRKLYNGQEATIWFSRKAQPLKERVRRVI